MSSHNHYPHGPRSPAGVFCPDAGNEFYYLRFYEGFWQDFKFAKEQKGRLAEYGVQTCRAMQGRTCPEGGWNASCLYGHSGLCGWVRLVCGTRRKRPLRSRFARAPQWGVLQPSFALGPLSKCPPKQTASWRELGNHVIAALMCAGPLCAICDMVCTECRACVYCTHLTLLVIDTIAVNRALWPDA